jgi:hypothetical protein
MSKLAKANLILFVLLIAHLVDHAVNQPTRDLPATGTAAGLAGFVIVATAAVLAIRRSPLAPAAAIVSGAATAAGFVAIHLLPSWSSEISDPYWDFSANAISWALIIAPLIAAGWLIALGVRELRAGRAPSQPRLST